MPPSTSVLPSHFSLPLLRRPSFVYASCTLGLRLGLELVCNDTLKCAAHYVVYRRKPGYLFFAVGYSWRLSYRSFVRGGQPLLRSRGFIASSTDDGNASTRQLRIDPNLFGSNHTGKYIKLIEAVIHVQVLLASGAPPPLYIPGTHRG